MTTNITAAQWEYLETEFVADVLVGKNTPSGIKSIENHLRDGWELVSVYSYQKTDLDQFGAVMPVSGTKYKAILKRQRS